MPPLVSLRDLSIGFRGPPLLDGVDCQIETGEKIGLLGRNGAGKTTLMRLLLGQIEPDAGSIEFAANARCAYLPQDVPELLQGNVRQVVAASIDRSRFDESTAWQADQHVARTISEMELDSAAEVSAMSSGMKRRVLLARALADQPGLLLLDEPTNHLDMPAIQWLEQHLQRWPGTVLFITHDRMFLRKLATRILEIDRGRLFDWSCDYDTFLQRKEAALADEARQHQLFDKKLAEEERWIRQGIKARRTRNEGRVRALKQMRNQRAQRRDTLATAQMKIQEAERSGVLVADLNKVSFAYGERQIVNNFSCTVLRGDKIGIVGPNGVGKTTLLRILLGQLAPEQGTVRLGTRLQIAYFDQLRQQLDETQTVQENVGDGYDTVQSAGGRKHILGYLQDFLFTPERARTHIKQLSGGERHRVLLAKLFAKPANVLVLDEPTNDLDTETLELLEELVAQFQGTVLVVSHDREFLNRVVTSTLVFEDQNVKEYAGGYDDYLRQRGASDAQPAAPGAASPPAAGKPAKKRPSDAKLSYNERRELESLPQRIEAVEGEIESLHARMADPEFYQLPGPEIAAEQARLQSLDDELAELFERWEQLETKQ